MPHFLLQLISPTPAKIIKKYACIKLYEHVEQLISSSAMSKVAADNKLPNKSVNRLPYGLFTLRLQNNLSVQDICLYRCVTAYNRVILYFFFEVNNLRSDMTHTLVSILPPLKILPHGIHGGT